MSDYFQNSEMTKPQRRDQQQEALQASLILFQDTMPVPLSGQDGRGSYKKDLRYLSCSEIGKLTNEEVANLPIQVLLDWNSAQFSSLSKDQLEALTRDQLAVLTENQVKDLTRRQIDVLIFRNKQAAASLPLQERLKALWLMGNPSPSR